MRLNNIILCLRPALALLSDLQDAYGTPFLPAISSTTLTLINALQNIKKNKEECTQLMENVYGILYAIINLHVKSETVGDIPPAMLASIGAFTETLYKIHAFVEMQEEGNRIKHFFRQGEIRTQLKDCQTGMQQALEAFKMETAAAVLTNLDDMRQKTEDMHQAVLELISTLSDTTLSDRASSLYRTIDGSINSSNSFSLLPGRPKIFHGRELQLESILTTLNEESARIAILGAGGMGKTSLARATMHHHLVAAKYQDRFFVACESASNSLELAASIAAHLGLKPGKDMTKPIIQYFAGRPLCLLILDNLETAWEPLDSRGAVEELLSLLTDIPQLALIITMRGAERPAKVRWTRPFLLPLQPLSDDAARQTFIDITDNFDDPKDIDQLLRLTDNMPLAVDLIAHLVDYEGCSDVLARWETERTSVLSDGNDRRSNLDASIMVSLTSPRITSLPGAKDLLSLLAILPDGLSDTELLQSHLAIPDVLKCKAALLSTSLAYADDRTRLKSLVPIREHMQHFCPPAPSLVQALCKHFRILLDLYEKYRGSHQMGLTTKQIMSNLGNLHQLLLQDLHADNPDIEEAIECTIALNNFMRSTGPGWLVLMDQIPSVLPQPPNHRLEAKFITERLHSQNLHAIVDPESLIAEAKTHFTHFNDPVLEAQFNTAVGYSYLSRDDDTTASLKHFYEALSLARSCGSSAEELVALNNIADLYWRIGDYSAAQMHATEAQRLAKLSANLYAEAGALHTKAICYMAIGNYKDTVFLEARAKELLRLCDMLGGSLYHTVVNCEAETHFLKSEYIEARQIHARALRATSAEQDAQTHAWAIMNIAEIDLKIGAEGHAISKDLAKAKTLLVAIKQPFGITLCDILMGELILREGDRRTAKAMFQSCLKAVRDAQVMTLCLEKLANVNSWSSDTDGLDVWTAVFLASAQKSRQKLELHKALQFLGDLFILSGDEDTANSLFIVALEGFTYMDIHRSRANCMIRLGDIADRRGDPGTARKLWTEARPLFERSRQSEDVSQLDIRLQIVDNRG
ncbi:hypothetical protein FB451DRAFT_1255624 [Mycena latifolia]|nr:hypothetical protein FB451DRAFT_1255624 [Mycena latifolia]